MLAYDFGCGKSKRDGCIGVDWDPNSDATIIGDLTQGIPELASETADFVCSSHVLEHIPYPLHWKAIEEMLRILKTGGNWEFIVPHPGNDSAMVPDHKHWFSVLYFENMQRNPLPNMLVDEIVLRRTSLFDAVKQATGCADEIIEKCFRNTIEEIIVRGRKVIPSHA